MRVQEFAFRAEEDSADSLDVDFETRDMSVIVQIKSAVNDTETEITDMEFNNEYIDENRLVDLEQNLEKEESFLDGLANEADERGEKLTAKEKKMLERNTVNLFHQRTGFVWKNIVRRGILYLQLYGLCFLVNLFSGKRILSLR